MAQHPLVSVRGISKRYPGVAALSDVSLDVPPGQVHALVGENGAGKSTLARIIGGVTTADHGQMTLDGQPYSPQSRRDASRRGVQMVMQELNLIANLTVAESIFFDRMPRRLGMIRYRTLRAHAAEVLSQVGMADLRPEQYIRDLGVGQQQLVEIAAGLSRRCRLLILDEPTAALTQRETDLLFAQISRLKATGASILYISHRMEEIKRVADRITVLRDGCLIAAHDAARVNIDQIIAQMVGRELGQSVYRARPRGDVALSVRNLSRGSAVRDVSFEVHRGEILGIAGLMGSGRTEMVRAIFGADRPDQGEIRLSDRPVRIRSPRDAVRHGLALLTEDRKAQGLLLPMPIRANATLARLRPLARLGGWLSGRRETSAARSLVVRLGIRCHGVEQPVLTLSGGNQQKVVIAKWLWRDCGVLIFDEPTRGIDVGARFEIYRLLLELAAAGKAIVIVCSDLVELLSVCDRIAVMSAGRLVQTFDRGQWTADAIMAAALSQYVNP